MGQDLSDNPVAMSVLNSATRKPLPSGQEPRKIMKKSHAKMVRDFMTSNRKSDRDENGHNRLLQVLHNMVRIAKSSSPQAVAAAQLLFARGWGKDMPSTEEQEAIARGGIQIVYIGRPEKDVDITEVQPALPPKPEFIDAEWRDGE